MRLPAGDGVGTAPGVARAYSAFAEGGAELGIAPDDVRAGRGAAPDRSSRRRSDRHPNVFLGSGLLRPGPDVWFGSSPRRFPAPGAGGSFACADPDAHLGIRLRHEQADCFFLEIRAEKPLRDAVHRRIRRTEPELSSRWMRNGALGKNLSTRVVEEEASEDERGRRGACSRTRVAALLLHTWSSGW